MIDNDDVVVMGQKCSPVTKTPFPFLGHKGAIYKTGIVLLALSASH